MANSKIGQYQVEYKVDGYTAPVRSHMLRMWVSPTGSPAPGTPPAAITIQKLGGATASLQAVVDQAWSYFRLNYAALNSVSGFTLWKYVTENSRDFITAGAVALPAGSGGSTVIAWENVLTFRHALGGVGKLVFIEGTTGGDAQIALVPNAAGTALQRIAAYIMSADSPMIALDNSFPVSPLHQSSSQNEAAWRKVYRGT